MCTASARSERLPVHRPTPASTSRNPAVRPNTARSRCLWREPWVWRWCACPAIARSASRGHDQLGFSLADALAREEPGVRLEGVAELAERAVELGRARVHLEDREDPPVVLDEGDVECGRHVLHVELGEGLLAEVEEDQVPLDLVGRRALEAGRLALAAVGQLHAEG